MTVKLSPQTVSKIMRLFFSGMPQPVIAIRAGVDQSKTEGNARSVST
jgi:hypothetical protein